jgi:hypothetical protein
MAVRRERKKGNAESDSLTVAEVDKMKEQWCSENERVDAIQNASVSRQRGAKIFDAQVSLQRRKAQISRESGH